LVPLRGQLGPAAEKRPCRKLKGPVHSPPWKVGFRQHLRPRLYRTGKKRNGQKAGPELLLPPAQKTRGRGRPGTARFGRLSSPSLAVFRRGPTRGTRFPPRLIISLPNSGKNAGRPGNWGSAPARKAVRPISGRDGFGGPPPFQPNSRGRRWLSRVPTNRKNRPADRFGPPRFSGKTAPSGPRLLGPGKGRRPAGFRRASAQNSPGI